MNRRSFFNKMSAAILGTVISLRLPDQLVPLVNTPEPEIICRTFSFTDLFEAYFRCGVEIEDRNEYPTNIEVSEAQYEAISDKIVSTWSRPPFNGRKIGKDEDGRIRFMDARIYSRKHLDDTKMEIYGQYWGNLGRFKLDEEGVLTTSEFGSGGKLYAVPVYQ